MGIPPDPHYEQRLRQDLCEAEKRIEELEAACRLVLSIPHEQGDPRLPPEKDHYQKARKACADAVRSKAE